MSEAWSQIVRLDQIPPKGRTWELAPDEAERAALARELDLDALPELSARLTVTPWRDGVEVNGLWRAKVGQTCGVTLEPLENDLAGDFRVRAVGPDSKAAPSAEYLENMDPEADDLPDIVENGEVDLARLVVEHLSLEIDPFPRKDGASFEPPETEDETSPFAVLKNLRKDP